MSKLADIPREVLEERQKQCDLEIAKLKAESRAISSELGFRDQLSVRARALVGMTGPELARLVQTVSTEGIVSSEAFGSSRTEVKPGE